MSTCCQTSAKTSHPKRQTCPVDGNAYLQIGLNSILHQLSEPWNFTLNNHQNYYYCSNPNCDVVYFGADNSTISTSQLKSYPSIPQNKAQTLCYCYGVRFDELRISNQAEKIKQFIIQQTQNGACACETKNISGRCCLKDFPR